MSKTVLADVDGFTPVIDCIADELGLASAAVFGKIWRYCQMEDGVCKASLETISQGLGIDRATVQRHAEKLCSAGYLKDLTPDLKNRPHVYADTGKAGIRVKIGVAQRNVDWETVAGSNADVAGSNAGVANSTLNKVLKESLKEMAVEEQKVFHILQRAASGIWPLYASEWRTLSKDLTNAKMKLEANTIRISGLGIKAAYCQDHYAKVFENQLTGIMNPDEGTPKVIFEE